MLFKNISVYFNSSNSNQDELFDQGEAATKHDTQISASSGYSSDPFIHINQIESMKTKLSFSIKSIKCIHMNGLIHPYLCDNADKIHQCNGATNNSSNSSNSNCLCHYCSDGSIQYSSGGNDEAVSVVQDESFYHNVSSTSKRMKGDDDEEVVAIGLSSRRSKTAVFLIEGCCEEDDCDTSSGYSVFIHFPCDDKSNTISFLLTFLSLRWSLMQGMLKSFDMVINNYNSNDSQYYQHRAQYHFDVQIMIKLSAWNASDIKMRQLFSRCIVPLLSDKGEGIVAGNHTKDPILLLRHSDSGCPTILDVYLSCRAHMLFYGLDDSLNSTLLSSTTSPAPTHCRMLISSTNQKIDQMHCSSATQQQQFTLANMPDTIHLLILDFLSIQTQRYLRCVCGYWKDFIDGNRFLIKGLKCKLFNHQMRSLAWMEQREKGEGECRLNYDAEGITSLSLRGGILADEPGLGKTISIISLILRSLGSFPSPYSPLLSIVTPAKNRVERKSSPARAKSPTLFRESSISPHPTTPIVDRSQPLIPSDCSNDSDSHSSEHSPCNKMWNEMTSDEQSSIIRSLASETTSQIAKDAIYHLADMNNIVEGSIFKSLAQVAVTLQEALRNKGVNRELKIILNRIHDLSNALGGNRSQRQTSSRKKKEVIARADRALINSGGTLIITPAGLLQHWVSQIHKAIDFNYWNPDDCVGKNLQKQSKSSSDDNSLLFVDHRDGDCDLPPAEVLSRYAIVVVSVKRISREAQRYKKQLSRIASPMDEDSKESVKSNRTASSDHHHHNSIANSGSNDDEDDIDFNDTDISHSNAELNRSSLRQINWLRIIVDEGHQLGNSISVPYYVEFIRDIIAERRWILSGTPAKETTPKASLQSIFGILCFLRHEKFGREGGIKLWRNFVSQPFLCRSVQLTSKSKSSSLGVEMTQRQLVEKENERGFRNLCSILKGIMVRHLKEDVELELPKLKKRTVYLELTPIEKRSYNAIITIIRTNISLTSIDPAKGWSLSFLNPHNIQRGRIALRNIRVACQGWQNIPFLSARGAVDFALELGKCNVSEDIKAKIFEYTNRVQNGLETECMKCGAMLPFLHVTPCAHFFCPECFITYFERARESGNTDDMHSCMICKSPLDASKFALFQPGIDLKWMDEDAAKQKPSSKSEYIISALENIRKQNPYAKCLVHSSFPEILNIIGTFLIRHFGVEAIAEYWGKYQDTELAKFCTGRSDIWRCHTCGYDRNDPQSKTCNRVILEVTLVQDEGVHGQENPSELSQQGGVGGNAIYRLASDNLPGWMHGQVFTRGEILSVSRAAIGLEVSDGMAEAERMVNVKISNWRRCRGKITPRSEWIEHRNTECFVMLLHSEGALGLDLSMVTHIFLTDRIADSAVEDQIISRAFRLGSNVNEVVVEQLIGKGTIEEFCPPGMGYTEIIQSMRTVPMER